MSMCKATLYICFVGRMLKSLRETVFPEPHCSEKRVVVLGK